MNGLERHNGPYFSLISPNSAASEAHWVKVAEDVVVKSLRSLSHRSRWVSCIARRSFTAVAVVHW